MMLKDKNVIIRRMEAADIDMVEALEAANFHDPWSAAAFLSEMETKGSVALAAAAPDGRIAGYITARTVVGEVYINTVAVDENYRRRGIARALLAALEEAVTGAAFITLEARESNITAITLYSGLGYLRVGMRKGFYSCPDEDAVLMTKELPQGKAEIL